MIEIIIKNHLDSKLEEQVFLEKPSPSYGVYVVFEKTSSGKSNHLPSATFAFQSYGNTLYKAVELNEKVKQAVVSEGVEYSIIRTYQPTMDKLELVCERKIADGH